MSGNEMNETTVKKQERKYIPVTWGDIGRFFLCFFFTILSIANFWLIIKGGKLLGFGKTPEQLGQLVICWVIIGQYLLMGFTLVCSAALLKKGFKNLEYFTSNEWYKKGLIGSLIKGLTYGLLGGIAVFLLIFGISPDRTIAEAPISGIVMYSIFGLVAGLGYTLIVGLTDEF